MRADPRPQHWGCLVTFSRFQEVEARQTSKPSFFLLAIWSVDQRRTLRTVLDRSRTPQDVDLPGFRLHPLKGGLKGHYAVAVSGNWRVTFRFEDGDTVDVDYVDCH